MRVGIEATLSQNVRTCGLRRTRYRGLPKTHVQHVLTGLACNITRITGWIADPASTQPLPRPLHRRDLTPTRSPTESYRDAQPPTPGQGPVTYRNRGPAPGRRRA
ncbi:transposase [Streptomyces sp. NPDC056653]|uniref:transposase n=1 Tax=Streptomyces sp. NPDC056653 TaxID=3345894 RepID=UPI0036AA6B3F